MTTKNDERNALAEIRRIVDSLGPDSYIGMAFDGCWEIASDNIENDFACSMKERWESAREDAAHYHHACVDLTARVDDLNRALDCAEEENASLRREIGSASEERESLHEENSVLRRSLDETEFSSREKDAEIDALRDEIVHLKAKLYDYMVEGK